MAHNNIEPLPWHDRLWETCLRMGHQDRFSHAFLLRGPRGNGKGAFATRWANALVCQEPVSERRPCGRCRGCVLFGAGTHPDVRTIVPPSGKKSIGVDRIRELIDYVWLSRQLADRKVVIMPGAQLMTINAANTLLKTLEEPPGEVVFLLITDRSDRLPITVRSRCRLLAFPVPPAERVLPWLESRLPPGTDAAPLLAAAGGAPLLAMGYWEEGTLQERMRLDEELTGLLTGKADPLAVAMRWKEQGCTVLLPWMMGYVMELIRLRFRGAAAMEGDNVSPAGQYTGQWARYSRDADTLARLAREMDVRYGYRLLDRCLEARRLWEESQSLNEALLLEGIAIDFAGARNIY
uniref:DNA-directed DNA polymerase n=1 Tax=Candidatus Kentrum sp. FM TaxID=2126340 RepID=A0A450SD65_9GAMM|nr:MAG: DNA polymerase-3 subunit delta' [Candidatus Kentron sp. FM]VFJ50364.1 MAG: DNA polymerase-3 subunit delta' [Candidatus Kentron sp. FM]VFK08669.1 MAG: DNA polymerase-3 subunit delta' [Candidatus Kentron sp. FM]